MSSVRLCAIGLPLATMLPASAAASPTYLKCSFTEEGKTVAMLVAADEADGSVTTHSGPTGYSERRSAVFSPTSVRWASPSPSGGLRYALSRTNLSITRDLVIGDKTVTDHGTCKLQAPPRRAF